MNSGIIKKVAIITFTALVLLGVAGMVSWWRFDRVIANQAQMLLTTEALRNQMEADMMHDALRADVLAALHAVSIKSDDAGAIVRKELAEHASHFRDQVAANEKLPLPPTAAAAVQEIATPLATYITSAETIVSTAFKDPAAAEALMPEFLKKFSALEDAMSTVSDAIEACQTTASQANAGLIAEYHRTLLITIGAGTLVLSLLTVLVARSIPGPFRKVVSALSTTARQASETSHHVAGNSQELAAAAFVLATFFGKKYQEAARLCGLLHNVGQIVMLSHPDVRRDYPKVLKYIHEHGVDFIEAEREVIGFAHPLVGAMVARRWQLPLTICTTILKYADPFEGIDNPQDEQTALTKMAAALALSAGLGCPPGHPLESSTLFPLAHALGFKEQDFAGYQSALAKQTLALFATENNSLS